MRPATIPLLVAVIACGLASMGRAEIQTLTTAPASGIKVEVEGWTGLGSAVTGRDTGLIPVTITITNGSPADHVWTITPDRSYGGYNGVASQPSARLAVPGGATGKTTLFLGSSLGYSGHDMFAVSGHGVSDRFHVESSPASSRHGGGGKYLEAGISKDVQAAAGNPFAKYTLTGNPLDMARAPEDWRGWSAFRNVLLSEGEWRGLAGGARKAILDWAASGGRAGVLVANPTAERLDGLGFPKAGPQGRRRIGAGEIVAVPWDGKTLKAGEVEAFLAGARKTQKDLLEAYRPGSSGFAMHGGSGAGGNWEPGFNKLLAPFGERTLPVVPIITFLVIFGLVAGPLNVMVLAGKGRRSRMFWTTPAISLAATAFLLGLMFLRDGVGGAGARRVLGLLAPDQTTMAVIQEQFSRTGVLLGGSFPIAEPSWLQPVGLQHGQGTLQETDGRTRNGDWFRSRSDQAFLATAVRPSRARIEVVDGAEGRPPEVVSSIEVPLERVFVIDEDGRYWTAEDVGTGEKKPLVAGDAAAYTAWFATLTADAGPVRRAALDAVANLRGHAYATSRQAGNLAVATLESVRWKDQRADFAGPFTRSRTP